MISRTLAKTKNQNSTTFSLVFGKKLASRTFMPQSANKARDVENPNFGHNFGDVQVESPSFKQSCPLALSGPTHCPYGGACHTCPPRIQAKLKIGQPGDKYEQEADRVAEQVMRMPEPQVQRKACSSCNENDEEELIQAKPVAGRITPLVQRKVEEEEKIVQTKQATGKSHKVTTELANSIQSLRGGGHPLPGSIQSYFESRLCFDFSQVRVHRNAQATEAARAINARAFTLGKNVFFGNGQYVPESGEGRKLLAHELTHVMQQQGKKSTLIRDIPLALDRTVHHCEAYSSRPMLQRATKDIEVDSTVEMPPLLQWAKNYQRYLLLSSHIYDAIYGLGTNEELVYQSLQELDRDETAIMEFMEVYRAYIAWVEDEPFENLPPDLLIKDIEGDFSGDELDYALLLLNKSREDSELRIEARPTTTDDWDRAALRLYEAMPGIMGTEEEEVFAVLVSLNKEPAQIEHLTHAYQRLDRKGLKARLQDEFSDDKQELDYAMSLLAPNTSYEYFLRRGHEELAGRPEFGHPAGEFCNIDAPDKKELYDRRYWEEHSDPERRSCKLRLKFGIEPSFAVESMFVDADEWKIDCAMFVQILHLYALLHTLGPFEFDRRFGGGAFELRIAESSWIDTETLWFREGPTQLMQAGMRKGEQFEPSANLKPRPVDCVLADTPIGSRVMWHNTLLEHSRDRRERDFINENTLKLGRDAYSAYPLSSSAMTRRAIEQCMGEVRIPDGLSLDQVIRKYVYIREIEFYWRP